MSLAGRNGDGTPDGIPPDMVWDAENPPIIFECSHDVEHEPPCDGTCEATVTTEAQVMLLNEAKAWARAKMFAGGISASPFDTQMQLQAIQELVIEAGITTLEEVDDRYRRLKYDVMHEIRTANEEAIKEQRTRAALGLRERPKLLGPDGTAI